MKTATAPLQVRFKTKAYQSLIWSGEQERPFVSVKASVGRADIVNMAAFRSHPKYGAYANSDLAHGLIRNLLKQVIGEKNQLDTSNLPAGVSVDLTGFLAVVTIDLE